MSIIRHLDYPNVNFENHANNNDACGNKINNVCNGVIPVVRAKKSTTKEEKRFDYWTEAGYFQAYSYRYILHAYFRALQNWKIDSSW